MATAINSRALILVFCAALVGGAQSAYAGMPPGAFLQRPAPTVEALNRQVQTDPLVAARYARLYGMSPEMVRMAFSRMRLSALTEDHIYEVHYVHPGEKIGYKLRRVPKGTAVYRMPDGTPALVRVCGNPLKDAHPKAVKGAFLRAPEAALPTNALEFQPYEPLEMAASPTPSPVPSLGPRVGEPTTGFVPIVDLPGPTEIPITPESLTPVTAAASAVRTVTSFANGVPILGALGALGGVAALAGGSGGGGGGGGATTPPVIIPTGPSTTPEPGPVLFGLALSVAGGYRMLCRRRKAKRG